MSFRPWKADEVPVGEVVTNATDNRMRAVILAVGQGGKTYASPTSPNPPFIIAIGRESISAEQMLGWWLRADGSPCGVPEP